MYRVTDEDLISRLEKVSSWLPSSASERNSAGTWSVSLEAGPGGTTNRVWMGEDAPSSSGAGRQHILENRIS